MKDETNLLHSSPKVSLSIESPAPSVDSPAPLFPEETSIPLPQKKDL